MKILSPVVINALKEALIHIYWFKNDLKSFLRKSLPNNISLGDFDFGDYTKRDFVNILVDRLFELNKSDELLKLAQDVCEMNSFEHLKHLDNSEIKISNAKNSVTQLKNLIKPYQENQQKEIIRQQKQKENQERINNFKSYQDELDRLKFDFCELHKNEITPQQKGFKLEKIMNDLFSLDDLDPKSSFKVMGEQIDGAFTLNNTEYLFEAKWTTQPINKADLVIFEHKVKSKLENTLGLFLSINGFSEEGLTAFQANDKVVILMDGSDLMAIFDGRISFTDLIDRKKKIASREGRIFVRYFEMIN